ncbi:unnamed protein product, partial [Musa hybrid cultivar]
QKQLQSERRCGDQQSPGCISIRPTDTARSDGQVRPARSPSAIGSLQLRGANRNPRIFVSPSYGVL